MAAIETQYLGDLRTSSRHILSGQMLLTDAPLDNNGKGDAFSPTDLLATSLGACMLTVMGIVARERSIDIAGLTCSINKIIALNPRRVSEIQIQFDFMKEKKYSEAEENILKRAALTCPVAESLHPELIQNVTFNF